MTFYVVLSVAHAIALEKQPAKLFAPRFSFQLTRQLGDR